MAEDRDQGALVSDQSNVYQSRYSYSEEITHTLSHGFGFLLALGLTVWMVYKAAWAQSEVAVHAVAIYGVSVSLMFAASTLYHGSYGSRFQRFFKMLDHASIFLKIAGTVTPFALLGLPGNDGLLLLYFTWAVAAFGIVFKIFSFVQNHGDRYRWFSLALYLLMGWSAIVLVEDLWAALPRPAFFWMVAGGVVYTIGAIIYAIRSIPMGHFIWHVFVLAASACHAVAVAGYLLP